MKRRDMFKTSACHCRCRRLGIDHASGTAGRRNGRHAGRTRRQEHPADPEPQVNDIEKYPKCNYCGMDRIGFTIPECSSITATTWQMALALCVAPPPALTINVGRGTKAIWVGDNASTAEIKPLVDAEKATFLVGSGLRGVMTQAQQSGLRHAGGSRGGAGRPTAVNCWISTRPCSRPIADIAEAVTRAARTVEERLKRTMQAETGQMMRRIVPDYTVRCGRRSARYMAAGQGAASSPGAKARADGSLPGLRHDCLEVPELDRDRWSGRDGQPTISTVPRTCSNMLQALPKYAPAHNRAEISKFIVVTEFYNLEKIEARKALYVMGSDVMGPMGHELVPFATRADAEDFLKDHKGERILQFDEVTPEIIAGSTRASSSLHREFSRIGDVRTTPHPHGPRGCGRRALVFPAVQSPPVIPWLLRRRLGRCVGAVSAHSASTASH